MKITSLNNDKVKYWTSLKLKKNRDRYKCFLIEGDHLINEAQKRGLIIAKISTTDQSADYLVTKEIMAKISNQLSIGNNVALAKYIPSREIAGNVIILDNIQDPGNLGTLIRCAVAFDFPNIILSETSVDLYNPKVIRATEGMIFNVNVIRTNINTAIRNLKNKGYTIISTDVSNGNNIKEINAKNIAIILGNEGSGVNPKLKNISDYLVNINMNKSCESLNVGVAGGILMYEVYNGRINNSR